jgi:peptide/nickel transport system ATP-binding protein
MRQRVTIALATILTPKIIIADEPSTALDVVAQRGVIQLLKDIQSSQKNTIILVTHDMGVHATISNRIAIMYAGNIIEEAKTEELYENPLHPYTKYLIGSLPKIGDKSYKISAPGTPPSLVNPPSGCRFHPRCVYIMPECKINIPKFVYVKPQHKVACFLYSKEVEA